MRRPGGVVVGVDGSYGSAKALRRALHEASQADCELTVVHAWHPGGWETAEPRRQAELVLQEEVDKALAELPDAPAFRVVSLCQDGDPGRVLTQLSEGAKLVVLGRSGSGHLAGAFLGSVVRHLLHHSRCPVMVVPDPGLPVGSWGKVVVGFDGSGPAVSALPWALAMARRERCPMRVVHVWGVAGLPAQGVIASLDGLGEAARQWLGTTASRAVGDTAGVDVALETVHGTTTATLLARVDPADLLVVGARGRGGFRELLLGSVAGQLAEHAPCVLVVVR